MSAVPASLTTAAPPSAGEGAAARPAPSAQAGPAEGAHAFDLLFDRLLRCQKGRYNNDGPCFRWYSFAKLKRRKSFGIQIICHRAVDDRDCQVRGRCETEKSKENQKPSADAELCQSNQWRCQDKRENYDYPCDVPENSRSRTGAHQPTTG